MGFTPGWIKFPESIESFKKLLRGVPDLQARIEDCVAEGSKVYARLKVTGTHKGPLFGIALALLIVGLLGTTIWLATK